MTKLDNHVYTNFSRDAKDTMEDVIKRAIDIVKRKTCRGKSTAG